MSEVTYLLEASTDTVIYDPDAEEGSRLSPSSITLFAYQIIDGVKSAFNVREFDFQVENDELGYTALKIPEGWFSYIQSATFTIPENIEGVAVDTSFRITALMIKNNQTLATIEIPIVTLEVGEVVGEVERIDGELEGELISVIPELSGVIEADDGSLIIAGDLVIQATTEVDVPLYDGSYEVSPLAGTELILPTSGKRLEDDVTVLGIPYYETTNESGGYTVIIG